jgi:Tol biopolymer transport system component
VYRPPYLPGQEPLPSRERRRTTPVLAPLLAFLGLLLVGGASVWAASFLGLDLTRAGALASAEPSPGPDAASPGPGVVAVATDQPVVAEPDPTVLPDVVAPPTSERATVTGTILFSRGGDIWAVSGQELRRLTTPQSEKSDASPAWSPDGRSVYFIRTTKKTTPNSREGGMYSLYVTDLFRMNADGKRQEKVYDALIKAPAGLWFSHVLQPDVDPDGGTVAVVSDGPDGTGPVVLHLLENRGGRLQRVDAPAEGDLGHNDPDWSPDGSRIAFTFNHAQGTDGVPRVVIHQCRSRKDCVNGKDKELRLGFARPSWSPDGEWLAVEATRGNGRDIAIVDPTRGDVRVLLTDDGNSFAPSVSPEGDQIAYLHRDGVKIDLRLMTLDIAADGKITLVDDRAVTDDGSIDGESRPAWFIPSDETPARGDGEAEATDEAASAAPDSAVPAASGGAPAPPG